MISSRSLALCVVVILSLAAVTASAEMTFEPDEVEEAPDDEADDDEMTFAPDDLDEEGFDPDDEMDEDVSVGVVAVPGDDISAEERDELQEILRKATDRVPEITTYGDTDLLPALEERGPVYCSRESLCLGSVGESAAVERIVQARVEIEQEERADGEGTRGTYRLDIDYFDVDDRLFVAYHSNSGLSDFEEVLEAVGPGVDDIFDIRRDDDDDIYVDQRDVDVQSVISYSAGGASVLSLVTGIVFGLQASGYESDLREAQNEDGEFPDMTRSEARDIERSMENSALTANVFYGLSVGLAALGAGLFFLGGDDGPAETAAAGDEPWYRGVEITPYVDDDGLGVGTRLDF